MMESRSFDGRSIGQIYDKQSSAYGQFADERFAWKFLERPAFDDQISDLYNSKTRVLDIGCGTGVVARHLISKGILPENIIGIDPSAKQLEQARLATPGVTFIKSSAEDFTLPAGSVDLVVTNTVMHHLDNDQLARTLEKVYDVLSPGGNYFFVEVDPDHSPEGRDPRNANKWTTVKTPWRTEVPFFNRNLDDLVAILDQQGFDRVSGRFLNVSQEGRVDPVEYARYSSRLSRMGARFQKIPENPRFLRKHEVMVPDLCETPKQKAQREVVDQYFQAWETQSVRKISEIFSPNAVYDEKGNQIQGIDAIKRYWEENPGSQSNIAMTHKKIGFSPDGNSIWFGFNGSFDVRGKHVSIDGVIGFTIDLQTKQITHLTEHFTTKKTPVSNSSFT